MDFVLIVQILLTLFFGSYDSFMIFLECCLIVGLAKFFLRSGVKGGTR